jgi:hypothetical protein
MNPVDRTQGPVLRSRENIKNEKGIELQIDGGTSLRCVVTCAEHATVGAWSLYATNGGESCRVAAAQFEIH